MRHTTLLTVTSLLSIVLATLHLADDVVFRMATAGPSILVGIGILVVWMYGTLALAGRRAGTIIVLLGSLLGVGIPIIHMNGTGGMMGGPIGSSGAAFFFVWTMLALEATAMFSVVLAARELWSLPWRRPR
jgi:hypothetical protein